MSRLTPELRNLLRTKGIWTSLELAALVEAMQVFNRMSGIAREVASFLWHREQDLEDVNVELDEHAGNAEVVEGGDEVMDGEGQAEKTGEEEMAIRTEADLCDSIEEMEDDHAGVEDDEEIVMRREADLCDSIEEVEDDHAGVEDDEEGNVGHDQDVEVENDQVGVEDDEEGNVADDQNVEVEDDQDGIMETNQSDLEIEQEDHILDEATYPTMNIPNEEDSSSGESGRLVIDENPVRSPQEEIVIPQTDTEVKEEPPAVPQSRRKRRNHIEEPVVPTEPVQVKVEPASPNQDAIELEGRADDDMLFQMPSPPVINYSDDTHDFSTTMTSAPNLFPGWMGNGVDEAGVELPTPLWDTDFYGIPPELINASQESFSNPLLTPPPESLPYTYPYNSGAESNSVTQTLDLSENNGNNENAPFFAHEPQENVCVAENASHPPSTQDRNSIRIVLRRINNNVYKVVRNEGQKAKRKMGSKKDAPPKKRKRS